MVEGDGLENRCTGNCTEGSNPSLSAIYFLYSRICQQDKLRFNFSKSRCYRGIYDNSGRVFETHSESKVRPGFRKFCRFRF